MKALLFCCLCLANMAFAQDSVRYNGGYVFKDGIYLNFHAFRTNAPSIPMAAITDADGRRITDLRSAGGKLYGPDSTGTRIRVNMDGIWGFCDRGVVYVRAGDGYSRIGLMGSLAHLVYDATYRNFDPYMMGGGTVYTVQEQRFLDMATGSFLPVAPAGLYAVISRDGVLKEEFDALPKKQRRKDETLFLFMRRYNDRHPLYFPK